MSGCREAAESHQRLKRQMEQARGGGADETVRRVLAQLPIASQSFSASPYLDLHLFHYDERLVSAFERPKPAGDSTVRQAYFFVELYLIRRLPHYVKISDFLGFINALDF